MRLLMLRDNEKLSLTKDLITGIPPYAILSHTWGDDDQEVTLKDITDGTGQHKTGYRKILFCMRQAASDRLQYFWVDTCCIDKANHTEFSEAINSMFRWYRNATKCYVYLEDVPRPDSARIDDLPRSEWKLHFRKSRWFSRGWTLQELIAPSSVEFFSTDGYRLGNKKSLELLLHDITGIPVRVLQGHPLSGFGVEERISWSKGRRTKREEDKAYSLLGMLEVSMLPNYGEGEEKAFARLREEIRKPLACVFDKLPIADGAAFDSHAEEYNPTCHPDTRVDLLHKISRWAENSQAKSVFWLNGMAGTGKSTISRTLAHSFSRDGRLGASFFFKRGEGDRDGMSKFFITIAVQLVEKVPALVPYVKNAIDADPAIFKKVIREQFEKLILEPLSKPP
ncbi:hypothetical protein DL767_009639 [Monosporascus sp. MG133]|nr:hypothetical protein DL767_009639 [Monosporascus sp. MG133]